MTLQYLTGQKSVQYGASHQYFLIPFNQIRNTVNFKCVIHFGDFYVWMTSKLIDIKQNSNFDFMRC